MKQGDLVLVKEADSALHNDCVHVKLTHDRWTGPWTVTAVITPGLCYRVTLQGRRERVRRAAASHIKPYHLRPPSLRHDFGDEYAHFAWGPDLGLVTASILALPLYTLVDRLHDTASKRIMRVEIPRTLSQRFPLRVYHRK